MTRAHLLVPLVAWLAACGTTSGRIGELPHVANGAGSAKVVVVRVSSVVGAANGYTVALDGKDLLGIGSGEHAEFQVPIGEHFIGVKCFGGFSPTWKKDSLPFQPQPGETRFFVISPSATCAEIKPANETEAKKLIVGSKPVDLSRPVSKQGV